MVKNNTFSPNGRGQDANVKLRQIYITWPSGKRLGCCSKKARYWTYLEQPSPKAI